MFHQEDGSAGEIDMRTTERIEVVREIVRQARHASQSIGFVPTMGALHAGHVSLIEASRRRDQLVVVSIFVNPTQFGPQEDLSRYPRTLAADLDACEQAGADLVFHPQVEDMYPPGATTTVEVGGVSEVLEGPIRPGHFRGVATVVTKLLNIVQPDRAYFGQKDFQQQLLIRRMCRDLDLPVEIVTCPIVRDPDGLAMSSRNVYLSDAERQSALVLSAELRATAGQLTSPDNDFDQVAASFRRRLGNAPGVELEYAVVADPESLVELHAPQDRMVLLVAARVGTTRLIDNWLIEPA